MVNGRAATSRVDKATAMTLNVAQPPGRTSRAAQDFLGRLRAGSGFVTRGALGASSKKDLWLAAPHPVFNLAVADIGFDDSIARARMTGWRFFVLSRGRTVATMEFATTSRRVTGRFARVTDGRMGASSARAIARAEASLLTADRRYTLGMLRIPALHVYALWLRDHDEVGRHDLFAAVGSVPAPMTAERWVPFADFFADLQEVRQAAPLPVTPVSE